MSVSAERTWQVKVEQMRKMMEDNPYRPTALLLSALDETACKFMKPLLSPDSCSCSNQSAQNESEAVTNLHSSPQPVQIPRNRPVSRPDGLS